MKNTAPLSDTALGVSAVVLLVIPSLLFVGWTFGEMLAMHFA